MDTAEPIGGLLNKSHALPPRRKISNPGGKPRISQAFSRITGSGRVVVLTRCHIVIDQGTRRDGIQTQLSYTETGGEGGKGGTGMGIDSASGRRSLIRCITSAKARSPIPYRR